MCGAPARHAVRTIDPPHAPGAMVDAQRARPGFVRPAAALVALEERQVGHVVGGDELVFRRRKLRLPIDAPPRARVEVHLVEHVPFGVAGVQRHAFGEMRVPVDDVLRAAVAEILLGQRMPMVRASPGPRMLCSQPRIAVAQPVFSRLLNLSTRDRPSTRSTGLQVSRERTKSSARKRSVNRSQIAFTFFRCAGSGQVRSSKPSIHTGTNSDGRMLSISRRPASVASGSSAASSRSTSAAKRPTSSMTIASPRLLALRSSSKLNGIVNVAVPGEDLVPPHRLQDRLALRRVVRKGLTRRGSPGRAARRASAASGRSAARADGRTNRGCRRGRTSLTATGCVSASAAIRPACCAWRNADRSLPDSERRMPIDGSLLAENIAGDARDRVEKLGSVRVAPGSTLPDEPMRRADAIEHVAQEQ